jgi:hypothetical protein
MGHFSFWLMLMMICCLETNLIEKEKLWLHVSKEVGLKVNLEKTFKYIFMSHLQTASQNHCIRVAKTSFKNVAKLGMPVTKLPSHRSRLNSGNAVQNVLSFHLLYQK